MSHDPFDLSYLNSNANGVAQFTEPEISFEFGEYPNTRLVSLTRGFETLVDESDYYRVLQHVWCVNVQPIKRYAYRNVTIGSRRQSVYLHRWLLAAPRGVLVDHRNGNGLDNRSANIRMTDVSTNNRNRNYCGASGYRGVSNNNGNWRARISGAGGARITLGTFKTPIEAAKAYDRAAIRLFGPDTPLNFKEEDVETGNRSYEGIDIPF